MKKLIIIGLILMFCLISQIRTCAAEEESTTQTYDVNENYNFSDVQEFIDNNDDNKSINFQNIVENFIKGDTELGLNSILGLIKSKLTDEIIFNKGAIERVLILAIIAAIFTNFAKVFQNNQISETGFFISYLLIIAALIGSFTILSAIAYDVVKKLVDFMKALLPVYMVSVGVSEGQAVASSFYEIALIVIGIIDFVCLKVMIPITNIYVIIGMINNLSSEDYLSKACELIRTVVTFLLKAMLTFVMGINVIQSMLTPVSQTIRNNAAKNVVGLLAGMAGTGGNVADLLFGTGRIVKSAIGATGLIVISVILIIPIIKIIIFMFSYQVANVIIQPVSDKRIVNCISYVTNGAKILARIVCMSSLMFVITIAIICLK